MLISNSKGQLTNAMLLFTGLQRCEERILSNPRRICGVKLSIAGVRCPDGGYLIIATTESPNQAIEIYRHRWQIETLFGCLKTRGFNMEDTHLTDPNRIMKLIAVLAVSFAWAHKLGEWQHQVKPIVTKNHGRKAESIFHYGLRLLRQLIFSQPGVRMLRCLIHILEWPPSQIQRVNLGISL